MISPKRDDMFPGWFWLVLLLGTSALLSTYMPNADVFYKEIFDHITLVLIPRAATIVFLVSIVIVPFVLPSLISVVLAKTFTRWISLLVITCFGQFMLWSTLPVFLMEITSIAGIASSIGFVTQYEVAAWGYGYYGIFTSIVSFMCVGYWHILPSS